MFKISLFISLLCLSVGTMAQIEFFGVPEPIATVNSPSGENYLVLDGNTLYFSREKHPENEKGPADAADIWTSVQDTTWSAPKRLAINDGAFAAPIGFSADGNYFLYSKTWTDKGMNYGGVFAFHSDRPDQEVQVDIPYFKNQSPLQTGTLSADGRYLLLSLENNLGFGVDDLFVCMLQPDGRWSAPKNLGANVNTEFQELTPFLAADNKTLFFASNGLGGAGSFDLFVSTRLDETWQNWSAPRNLGEAVNTVGSELSLVFASGADYAYFTSTQNSDGYGDVKRIRITAGIIAEERAIDTTEFRLAVEAPEAMGANSILFQLVDEKTNEPVTGTALVFLEEDTLTIQAVNDGIADLTGFSSLIDVEFKAKGYFSHKLQVDPNDPVWSAQPNLVKLEPLATGNVITLSHVLFYRGTANFVEGSESELDLVVEMLNENPDVQIFLKGHTDNVGVQQLNVELSQERVNAVQNYLTRQGIAETRISGKGFGGSQPVASNDTEETRKLNRRVEFEVVRE